MARTRLTDRRFSVTQRTVFVRPNGDNRTALLITVGFDGDGVAKEVFCADFKAGSDFHLIVIDVCILISRLLQHGEAAADLFTSMSCDGQSLPAQIIRAVVNAEAIMRAEADADTRTRLIDGGAAATIQG
jgi:hypothetical protein